MYTYAGYVEGREWSPGDDVLIYRAMKTAAKDLLRSLRQQKEGG